MALFSQSPVCVGCKAELPKEARFCPQCAQPASDVYRRCPMEGCDGIATQDDEFCVRCGMRLPKVDREVSFDLLWDPPRGELARRYRIDTEEQAVEGTISVRFGREALLLGDGKLLKTLGPGAHPIETTFRDLHVGAEGPRRFEVVFFDASEYTLNYTFAGLPSKDGLPCLADLRLVVEVREPERLLANAMKNVETVTHEGLRLRVKREVRNAVQEGIGQWPADDLAGSRERKDELAGIVGTHMRRTLEGLGFSLLRVETLDAHSAALQDVHAERTERGVEHYMEKEGVARLEQEAEIHELKANAWARMRESVDKAEKGQVSDKAALQEFLRNINKESAEKDAIAEHELDRITTGLTFERQDRDMARRFILLRLKEEQDLELDQLAAKRTLFKLETEIEATRKAVEMAKTQAGGEIDIRDMQAEAEARAEKRKEMFGLDILERKTAIEGKSRIEALHAKGDIYRQNKLAKSQAAALELEAAGKAGLTADQITALFAKDQPELVRALETAFAGRGAEERAELERRHAGELREIFEAAQQRDSVTVTSLIDKLSGALGSAARERATSGDREAEATRDTVGLMRGEGRPPERKRCRVCHCEWLGDSDNCPSCGEAIG